MRLDGYDKWLLAGADSQDEDEKEPWEWRDDLLTECAKGEDAMPEFLSEDCHELNKSITEMFAKHESRKTDENGNLLFDDEKAGAFLLKLLYPKFVEALDKQAEYRRLWSY